MLVLQSSNEAPGFGVPLSAWKSCTWSLNIYLAQDPGYQPSPMLGMLAAMSAGQIRLGPAKLTPTSLYHSHILVS